MRIDSAAHILRDTLTEIASASLDIDDAEGNALATAIADGLRVLNINGRDIIDISEQAWGVYTFAVLAEVANDRRVLVETEVYALVNDLFYAVRAGNADLSAFFYSVLGKNL